MDAAKLSQWWTEISGVEMAWILFGFIAQSMYRERTRETKHHSGGILVLQLRWWPDAVYLRPAPLGPRHHARAILWSPHLFAQYLPDLAA